MKQGNSDQIIAVLEPSIEHSPGEPWAAAMSAKAALLSGQTQLGEQTLQTFLDAGNTPNDSLQAAQQALANNQIKAAVTSLNQFLTRPLTQRGAEQIEQALHYLQQGQWDDAETQSRRLLDLVPGEAIAHHIAALVNLGKGFIDEARASLEFAVRLRPDFTPSLVALGRLYLANQDFDQAMQVANALRNSAPDEPMGYALIGDIHLAQGDRGQAIDAYRKALSKADTRLAITNLSQRLVGLGDTQKVTEKLQDWIAAHPKDLELRIFLALQLQIQKDQGSAMAHYREALEQDPNQLVALNELAVWQQRQGKTAQAAAYAERAYSLSPGNPVIADTLGWIRLAQQRPDEAERLLSGAIEKLQGVAVAHYHYGILML
jgi:tetratricopeptide (TPR) repeat protein